MFYLKIIMGNFMKWISTLNYDEMSTMGAERLFKAIADGVHAGKPAKIGLATGNTMIKVYKILAEMLNDVGLDLSQLSTFNLDEYVGSDGHNVPSDHPLSYRKYMKENLFDLLAPKLGLKDSQTFFPDAANPEKYDSEIASLGGLDFQLLGSGFNGHIAFNEPISASYISVDAFAQLPSHIVELDKLTIQTNARLTAGSDLNAVPRKAATMGMASILKAKKILLLACFAEQAAPLQAIKSGDATPELPASFLLMHQNTEIIYTQDKIQL